MFPILGGSLGAGLLLFWFLGVRPYIHVNEVRLRAHMVSVSSESDGKLARCLAREGSWVEEGEVLFSLSAAKEEMLKAELHAKIQALRQSLSIHLAAAEEAMQEYLNARTELAMGEEDQSDAPLAKMQQQREMADKCSLQISLSEQELAITKACIEGKSRTSPLAGFVVQCQKQEGDLVEAGDTIYSICNPQNMWMEAVVPEKNIAQIQVGQKVYACLAQDPFCKWQGHVSWISPIALDDKQGVPIRIVLDGVFPKVLRPNMNAKIKIKVH